MKGSVARALSEEAKIVFAEGIGLLLIRWTALQAAVENEWGGRDSRRKAELIVSEIFTWFTQSPEPLYIDDLENILDEGMLSLNTMAEDGSVEEVAEKLMIMHEECLEGNYQSVEKLRATNSQTTASANVIKAANENDEDEEDDEIADDRMGQSDTTSMMVDAPTSQSNSNSVAMPVNKPRLEQAAEAGDGWTVVSSRRNRSKKN